MERKAILVMIDALGFQTACDRCGYLGHLVEAEKGALYRVRGELPPVSRPMYETIMTGLPVSEHGVISNDVVRPSRCENLFSLTKKNGGTTAAAAYMWIAELYNGTVEYGSMRRRFQMGGRGQIDNGIFYHADDYPDSHLYEDGDYLREAFSPDFLLIHPMNVDYQGHKHGRGSYAYEHAAEMSFDAIGLYLPRWFEAGYDVVVTADHGMDEVGIHFGDTPLQREVPLFIFSDKVKAGRYTDNAISQLAVAPLVCRLMGMGPAPGMIDPTTQIGWCGHEK